VPEHPPYRVVVVGAGFAGIGMAWALAQAGITDFLVVDRAGDLGGTWRDNTYPGLACDVPSNLYSFSFRPNRWSRRFPPRQERAGWWCPSTGSRPRTPIPPPSTTPGPS